MFEEITLLNPSTIDFSNAPFLLNRSKRFVLPVPELLGGGEELRYRDGPKSGEPIYTNKDGSVQKGIVFANKTDSAWQGVQGNGKEAIIINDLTEWQAQKLLAKITEIAPDISEITPTQIQEVLSYARESLNLVDMFDKDLQSIREQMRFVDSSKDIPTEADPRTFLGYMEVSKDTEHRAVRIEGKFSLEGPVLQQYQDGAIVVTSGKYTWAVDKGVVERNWVVKDWDDSERPISSVAAVIPEHRL